MTMTMQPPAVAVADSGSGASMLVVGARGAGGFAAMMLGSVSRHVAAWAPCPVVVVREETTAVHREIVVGVRDPEYATRALAFAFDAYWAIQGLTGLVAILTLLSVGLYLREWVRHMNGTRAGPA